MKTVGIIAEFNPFHNGHKYIIEKAKSITRADNVVVICSGNYVQRGEPSVYDKSIRTKAALSNGVDAVFELPVYYAISSAETFARAGIKFLNDLGCVDYLVFGCETDNFNALPTIANILYDEPNDYKKDLKNYLKEGISFPKARSNALKNYCVNNNLLNDKEVELTLKSSNNILAIEYLKAIKYFDSHLKPVAIRRIGAEYSSLDITDDYVSATAIRNEIRQGKDIFDYIPSNTIKYAEELKPLFIRDFDLLLGNSLLSNKTFNKFYGISNDLANRIQNQKDTFTDIEHFIMQIDSKNFNKTAISRALLSILLNIKQKDIDNAIESGYFKHARLLGINRSSNLMSEINDNTKIPIISKFSNYYKKATGAEKNLLDMSILADNIYRLVYMTKYKEVIPNEFERQIIVK